MLLNGLLAKTSNDEGLIPTKDDGPWNMLRRKGFP